MMRLPRRLVLASLMALGLASGAGAARAEETLFIVGDGVPSSLDTDGPAGTYTPTQEGILNLMDTLVTYPLDPPNADGVQTFDFTKFQPELADSWSFDAATNTWTIKLHQGVKSCAGNTFTADDVLYTFARGKSISGQAPVSYFLSSVGSVQGFTPALFGKTPEAMAARKLGDEVTKVDDYTVKIKLSGPNPLFMRVLSIFALVMYDSKDMQAHATPDDPWSHIYANTKNGAGFGPYCLESWKKDEEFVVRRNPDYYGAKPFYDRVIFRRVPQSSNRIAILRTGRAQVAEGLSPQELNSLKTAPGVKVAGGFLNASLIMLLNYKTPPFDNVKLRQAIAFAIPYADINKTSYFDTARQWNGLIPSAYPGYVKPDHLYSYDPAKAKAMLAEAGFPDGKGLDAYAEAFKLAYVAERESIVGPSATLIQTRFRELGIPVRLDPLPGTQFADRQSVKKDLPFALADQAKPIAVDPVYAMKLSYVTPPQGVSNSTNFSDPGFDALFNKVLLEQDAKTRQDLLDKMQNILAEKLAVVPILETKLLYAEQKDVEGLVLHPSQVLMWRYLHR
jgi:peptide/nickel transport system substrate-binding protein